MLVLVAFAAGVGVGDGVQVVVLCFVLFCVAATSRDFYYRLLN